MQPHRGRSRHISPVALARLASEERRTPLQDQIQAAYALDDIRLAKILLLRLKGITVTDERIDQVRDEDFDLCFTPLTLDDAHKRAIQDSLHRHRQSWHESQRAQRLNACATLWEGLHDEKRRAIQRREHDTQLQRTSLRPTRPRPEPFQYTCMPPSTSLPKSSKKTTTSHTRSVSFKEVINAMNGRLFPPDPSERADDARRIAGLPISKPSAHRRKASFRAELLDSLLQVVEWQQGERRKAKGKDVDRSPQPLKPLLHPTPILAVPSSVSTTSLSTSRSSSWLSFGSWRSTATDITTPDSPVLPSPTSQPCLFLTLLDNQRELHPRSAFIRISLEESPLSPPILSHARQDDHTCTTHPESATQTLSSLGMRGALVKRVTRSVTTIVEAAKSLQSAYITATMFAAGTPYRDSDTLSQPRPPSRCQRQVRREGCRALAKDVRKFTDVTIPMSQTCEPVHFIPLVSPPSADTDIPRPLVTKHAIIFPSPLRPRTPPAALAYRMRPVANPAVLRLKALQNLMCARGKQWEGRAREGGLGCGKERMLGIAFEGRGRSSLGCEVRYVVA